MVDQQLAARDIVDERVLAAMRRVPRHEFVPLARRPDAYADSPLPIGHGATISQPYMVAAMAQALAVGPTDRVLDVGTGSGYGAAVLAELAARVATIEFVAELASAARPCLAERYGDRVTVIHGDGSRGHAAQAPYDAIHVAASAPAIPPPLLQQLSVGGRLVAPVGDDARDGVDQLILVRRTATGFERERLMPVRFVPLRGDHGRDATG